MNAHISIFRPGAHYPALDAAGTGRTVSAYDPAKHEAPLVLGHPADDRPAYGWVQSLAFSEGLLKAAPRDVQPALKDHVDSGRYRKVSAGFYHPQAPGNPAPGVYYLRHVGFLGAQPPAVKGLPPVQFADSEDDYVTLEFSERDPWMFRVLSRLFRGMREQLIATTDLETANRVLPDWDIQALSDEAERQLQEQHPAPAPHFSEEGMTQPNTQTDKEAQLAQREADLNARQSQLDSRETALDTRQAQQSRQESVAFCEQLVTEGKLLPRDQDAMVEFMETLPTEATVTFAEGDSQVAKPGAAGRLSEAVPLTPAQAGGLLARRAPGTGEADPPSTAGMVVPAGYSVDPDQAQLHQRVLTFAEKHGVSYDEALTSVSRLEG